MAISKKRSPLAMQTFCSKSCLRCRHSSKMSAYSCDPQDRSPNHFEISK